MPSETQDSSLLSALPNSHRSNTNGARALLSCSRPRSLATPWGQCFVQRQRGHRRVPPRHSRHRTTAVKASRRGTAAGCRRSAAEVLSTAQHPLRQPHCGCWCGGCLGYEAGTTGATAGGLPSRRGAVGLIGCSACIQRRTALDRGERRARGDNPSNAGTQLRVLQFRLQSLCSLQPQSLQVAEGRARRSRGGQPDRRQHAKRRR